MEQRKWFAFVSGAIYGPYDRPQLEEKLSAWQNPLIWGRGQSEWVAPSQWTETLHQTQELIRTSQVNPTQMWRVQNGDQETKPMTHDQMMEFLKTLHDFSKVKLWTEGYADWKEIYQIHKIMDDLGVSRRTHPRVPIMGTLTCDTTVGSLTARLQSISEGGLGIVEAKPLKIGDQIRGLMKSSNLAANLTVGAEVVYVTNDGYAGLKFTGLPTEARTLIVEYVKKFQTPQNP